MNTVKYYQDIPYGDTLNARRFVKERLKSCHNLYRKTILGHYGCVNSISFSSDGEMFASGGDDRRVLLWRTSHFSAIRTPTPIIMKTQHMENIFSTVFDCQKNHVFSAGKDEDVLRHDIERRDFVGMYNFDEPVYSVDCPFDNPHLFVASGEDGTVQVIDVRTPTDRVKLASSCGSFHSAVFSPIESQFLATANSKDGIALWDIRRPLKTLKDFSRKHKNNRAMSVRFDYLGRNLLGLLRKGGPVLYDIGAEQPLLFEFSDGHYRNVCTMKTACFFGEKDEYIASGSDDFNVYVWKIPKDNYEGKDVTTPHLVLQGHRSIVNQVRYDRNHHLLASAGVEKCIKLWSSFPMRDSKGDITNEERFVQREKYTPEQYTRLTFESGQMSHDYASNCTEEDPQMLAMFDSLIERTKSDWAYDTDSDSDTIHDTRVNTILNLLFDHENSTSSSDNDNDHNHADNSNENENDDESTRAFGVSIDELRRIFRVNRRPQTAMMQSQTSSSENNSPRTMVDLSTMTAVSPQEENEGNSETLGEFDGTSTCSFTMRTCNGCTTATNISSSETLVSSADNTIPFHRRTLNGNERTFGASDSSIRTSSLSNATNISGENSNNSTDALSFSAETNTIIPFHRRTLSGNRHPTAARRTFTPSSNSQNTNSTTTSSKSYSSATTTPTNATTICSSADATSKTTNEPKTPENKNNQSHGTDTSNLNTSGRATDNELSTNIHQSYGIDNRHMDTSCPLTGDANKNPCSGNLSESITTSTRQGDEDCSDDTSATIDNVAVFRKSKRSNNKNYRK